MEYNLHHLFPTAVITSSNDNFNLTNREEKVILEHKFEDDNNYHNCHTSKNGRILEDRRLKRLKNHCQKYLNLYAKEIMKCDNKIQITNSWGNYSFTGNSHNLHRHSNSILSGIYYVYCNNSVPFLQFENQTSRYFLEYKIKEHNLFNSTTYQINLKDEMVVIFPSHLWHSVPKNTSKNWRISVSFNSFLLGEIDNYGYEQLKIKSANHV
jgi:uncharacterized protein (TIGR02466 family)